MKPCFFDLPSPSDFIGVENHHSLCSHSKAGSGSKTLYMITTIESDTVQKSHFRVVNGGTKLDTDSLFDAVHMYNEIIL